VHNWGKERERDKKSEHECVLLGTDSLLREQKQRESVSKRVSDTVSPRLHDSDPILTRASRSLSLVSSRRSNTTCVLCVICVCVIFVCINVVVCVRGCFACAYETYVYLFV